MNPKDVPTGATWVCQANEKTLRDEFAMAAMQGLSATHEGYTYDWLAKAAYEIADALLEARK